VRLAESRKPWPQPSHLGTGWEAEPGSLLTARTSSTRPKMPTATSTSGSGTRGAARRHPLTNTPRRTGAHVVPRRECDCVRVRTRRNSGRVKAPSWGLCNHGGLARRQPSHLTRRHADRVCTAQRRQISTDSGGTLPHPPARGFSLRIRTPVDHRSPLVSRRETICYAGSGTLTSDWRAVLRTPHGRRRIRLEPSLVARRPLRVLLLVPSRHHRAPGACRGGWHANPGDAWRQAPNVSPAFPATARGSFTRRLSRMTTSWSAISAQVPRSKSGGNGRR